MFRNNLRIACRVLFKKRAFTLINIAGLAIGLSAVLVILAYVREELSYDRFHENYERIYRITEDYKDDVKQVHYATNHGPLSDIISGRLSGLQYAVRILPYPAYVSADQVNKYRESGLVFADSTFFKIFSFRALAGQLDHALDAPFSAVLTRSTAQKYFGRTDVTGRELFYEDERASFTFHVTAVIDDVPANAHFSFDLLLNMASLNTIMPWYNNWHYPPMYLYVQTEKDMLQATLEDNIRRLAQIHQPPQIKDEKRKYYAQRLGDIHLHSALANEWKANNSIGYVKIFGGVSAFLLVIACINFMNLSTAQAAQRAREVGVRKVMGAYRGQLVRQFMGEAFMISLVSLLAALALAELLLMTFFKDVLDRTLSLMFLLDGYNSLYLVALLAVISLLSGLYPAFYLSRFSTVLTLRGKTEEAGAVLGLRRSLVVFQFFISGLLIIGTLVVLRQVNLMKSKNLGFDQEQLVALRMIDRHASKNYEVLKNELISENQVISVALSSEIPGGQGFHGFEVNPEGFAKGTMSMNTLGMDEDYLPTYNIDLIQGRNFSRDIPSDAREAFILNESAVRFLGWTPGQAIGKEFELILYTEDRDARKGKVIGVVKDFHYQSLHHAVEPLVLYINKHFYYSDFLTIRFSAGNVAETTALIERAWKTFHPEKPVDFLFLNDSIQRKYEGEMKISTIFSSFAVLSVIISCLGLFGLSAFSAQRRIKEIGIRKVLGASLLQILKLLSMEYAIMITLANVLAWPLAYYLGSRWLRSFPYRVSFGFEILLLTLLAALCIALLTVSVQSVKAALVNPVKTLKSE